MLTANKKSALVSRLTEAQRYVTDIIALEEMREKIEDAQQHEGAEHFEWYRQRYSSAISAGVRALAELAEDETCNAADVVDDQTAPPAESGVAPGSSTPAAPRADADAVVHEVLAGKAILQMYIDTITDERADDRFVLRAAMEHLAKACAMV